MTKVKSKQRLNTKKAGSILIMVLFVLALSAAMVTGILQLTTEEILQIKNQTGLAVASAVAEAGLHDAFAQIRQDMNWDAGFSNKPFYEDFYTVVVNGTPPNLTVVSTGQTSQGFAARMEAEIVAGSAAPHSITLQTFRINE